MANTPLDAEGRVAFVADLLETHRGGAFRGVHTSEYKQDIQDVLAGMQNADWAAVAERTGKDAQTARTAVQEIVEVLGTKERITRAAEQDWTPGPGYPPKSIPKA